MDVLSIGGTVIDTFIKLKDAEVHCDINNEHCTITMGFGDKLPLEFSKVVPAVGNSANAAVAFARLGLSSALFSALGKDRGGEDCLAQLHAEGVATELVAVTEGAETVNNYVLWYGVDRTILVKYSELALVMPEPMPAPRAVYLSALGEADLPLHDPLAAWLESHPEILFAFQPGTFEIKAGYERLRRVYARANVLIANKEEYQRILGSLEEDVRKLMEQMRARGPKIVFLTNGPGGAYAMDDTGAWSIGLYPDGKHPYERTGAGDAFSSTAVAALLSGKSVPEALAWGPVNAAFVVQKIGAQEGLLTMAELQDKLQSAPADYKAAPL